MTTKQNCLDFISRNLTRTSDWRRLQAAKFPEDQRNERASCALIQLASQAADVPDELWERLKAAFNPFNANFNEAVSRASRDVEFRRKPKSFNDYVESILETLNL